MVASLNQGEEKAQGGEWRGEAKVSVRLWFLVLSWAGQGHSQGQNGPWNTPALLTSQRPFGCGPSRRFSPLWNWCKSRTSQALSGRH